MTVVRGDMQDRGAEGPTGCRPRVVGFARACVLVFLTLGVTGCSTGGEGFLLLVDSGKYQYHSCEQIAAATKANTTRRQELATLIERAGQSPGGAVIGAVAYQADYTATGQELQILETTARSKNCPSAATWRSNAAIQ
jgi:hypothetical protein